LPINIEITSAPDIKALSAIHAACFESGWDAQAMAHLLSVAGTWAFVAPAGSGFALLRTVAGEAEILTLGVLPQHRKRGVGKAIVAAICAWAAERKMQAVFLEVRQGNEAAQRLYRKRGFALISTRKGYYRNADGSTEDAALLRYTP